MELWREGRGIGTISWSYSIYIYVVRTKSTQKSVYYISLELYRTQYLSTQISSLRYQYSFIKKLTIFFTRYKIQFYTAATHVHNLDVRID